MEQAIKNVMVVGYGAMGRGIALSFADAGFETTVLSRDPSRITDLPAAVSARAELPETAPDIVIEAVPERMDAKHALFRRLDDAYGGRPILASNTSSLSLEEMAKPLAAPERFIGIHYMHPPESLPLVEVIRVAATSDDTLARTVAALKRTGKHSIVLDKPVIGFLINRLQHAILHEAYYLIGEGVVSAEDVDTFARMAFGPRMCVTGLIMQKDLSGLDVHALAQRGIVPDLCHSAEPQRVLQDKYERGEFGAKTGKGFYDWSGKNVEAVRRAASEKLKRLTAYLQQP